MNLKTCFVAAAFLCLGTCLATGLATTLSQIENFDNPGHIPGEYLITLEPAAQDAKTDYVKTVVGKIIDQTGAAILNTFTNLKSPVLHVKSQDIDISKAFDVPEVVHIEANIREKLIQQSCVVQESSGSYWGLSRISSRPSPDFSEARFSYLSSGGEGVRVYVLDTGIRTTHLDFAEGRAVFGTNTIGGGDDDNNGHGTHSAGKAIGVNSGVAKMATAIAVKVLDDNGFGTTDSVVSGIDWVINDMQERDERAVISMSIGGSPSTTIDATVAYAVFVGITTVVPAGNEGIDACDTSPARAPQAITVGGTHAVDQLSFNWGPCIDILAPGIAIISASIVNDHQSVLRSGTSTACAMVAGAAAVYLSQHPNASPDEVKAALVSNGSEGYINGIGDSGTPNILLYADCDW